MLFDNWGNFTLFYIARLTYFVIFGRCRGWSGGAKVLV